MPEVRAERGTDQKPGCVAIRDRLSLAGLRLRAVIVVKFETIRAGRRPAGRTKRQGTVAVASTDETHSQVAAVTRHGEAETLHRQGNAAKPQPGPHDPEGG